MKGVIPAAKSTKISGSTNLVLVVVALTGCKVNSLRIPNQSHLHPIIDVLTAVAITIHNPFIKKIKNKNKIK